MSKLPTTPDILGKPLCIFCSYRCNRGIIAGKPEITFSCPYCCSVFSDKTVLNQHVMTHTKERSHKCTRCKYRTDTARSLLEHIKDKHIMCASCNPLRTFNTKAQFDIHWKDCHSIVNKNDDINLCTFCNYNCNRGIVSDDPEINSKAVTFDCFHCCNRFLQAKEMQDHINKTHTKERPYKCEDCDFRTESPYILETHHVWQNHVKGYLSNKAFLKALTIRERWSFFHPYVKQKNKKKRISQRSTLSSSNWN